MNENLKKSNPCKNNIFQIYKTEERSNVSNFDFSI